MHETDVKSAGSLGLFLLVPEYWLSSGQLQHGGSCLWSLPLWTLTHFHLFLHRGESVLPYSSSFPFLIPCFFIDCLSVDFLILCFPSCILPLFIYFPSLLFMPNLMGRQTLDDDPVTDNNNHWQSRPVMEWTNQQVCLWLIGMNMDQYVAEFGARGVDGAQLLNMDNEKLKVRCFHHIYNIHPCMKPYPSCLFPLTHCPLPVFRPWEYAVKVTVLLWRRSWRR